MFLAYSRHLINNIVLDIVHLFLEVYFLLFCSQLWRLMYILKKKDKHQSLSEVCVDTLRRSEGDKKESEYSFHSLIALTGASLCSLKVASCKDSGSSLVTFQIFLMPRFPALSLGVSICIIHSFVIRSFVNKPL